MIEHLDGRKENVVLDFFLLIKVGKLHVITYLRAFVQFSSGSRARRQAVDGWGCANACMVNLGNRSYLKLPKDKIKPDSH